MGAASSTSPITKDNEGVIKEWKYRSGDTLLSSRVALLLRSAEGKPPFASISPMFDQHLQWRVALNWAESWSCESGRVVLFNNVVTRKCSDSQLTRESSQSRHNISMVSRLLFQREK
jgi:hypothetical protein